MRQLLVRGVALDSATQTESDLLDEAGTILLAILTGLCEEVMSGDVISLALFRAQDLCQQAGINEQTFEQYAQRFAEVAARARKKNPLSCMF